MIGKTKKTEFEPCGLKNIFYGLLIFVLIFGLSGFVGATCVGTTQNFECGDNVTQSCTLNIDLTSTGTCFTVDADNITIDGAGYSITGNTTGNGIYASGRNNVTIKNFNVYNFSQGIYLQSSSNNTIINNTANDNDYGIRFSYSSNNEITNSTANNNRYGIYSGALLAIGKYASDDTPFYYQFVDYNITIQNGQDNITPQIVEDYMPPYLKYIPTFAHVEGYGINFTEFEPTVCGNFNGSANYTLGVPTRQNGTYQGDCATFGYIGSDTDTIGETLYWNLSNILSVLPPGEQLTIRYRTQVLPGIGSVTNNVEISCLDQEGDMLQVLQSLYSNNNTLTGNKANDNKYGIYLGPDSDFNYLINNKITNNNNTGIYFSLDSNNNNLTSNYICSNGLDINDSDDNSGDNNTCDRTYNWNDYNTTNCTYICGTLGPQINSTNQTGAKVKVFNPDEGIYTSGSGFIPNSNVTICVVNNTDQWYDGMEIPQDVRENCENCSCNVSVPVNSSGEFGPFYIWGSEAGYYDIVVDQGGDGYYNDTADAVSSATEEGFYITPEPMAAVLFAAGLSLLYGLARVRRG